MEIANASAFESFYRQLHRLKVNTDSLKTLHSKYYTKKVSQEEEEPQVQQEGKDEFPEK